MATPGGLTAGLAYLPAWLNDAKEPRALDALLSGWVRASGWKSAGLLWPLEPRPNVQILARPEGVEPLSQLPVEWQDVASSLPSSSGTVIWQVPQSSGRLYTLLQPPGRANGLLWAERGAAEPWKDDDRGYLKLSARLIERSAVLGTKIGLSIDPERLQQRLGDASIIAGRMAHDFDNILTGIIGFADLTMPLVSSHPQAAKYVSEIAKVGQRGIVFTQQLHQLSRSAQTKPQPGNMAVALAKEDLRLRGAMPAGMKVKVDVPGGLAPVAMEAVPLSTVLGHVLENAVEACSPNSTVHVMARAVELNAVEAKAYLGQVGPGAHIEVTVHDTGSGIKPDVRAKLFAEPFFTTKVRHRGLGLAIVYRVLHAHRGGVRIDAAAPPETGTVVRVVVPLAAARPAIVTAATVGTPTYGG